ncbi:hypothetical protein Q9189_003566 [Teloschistes chrysophthalmus]
MTTDYSKKRNAELEEILKARSLPHTGKKAELIPKKISLRKKFRKKTLLDVYRRGLHGDNLEKKKEAAAEEETKTAGDWREVLDGQAVATFSMLDRASLHQRPSLRAMTVKRRAPVNWQRVEKKAPLLLAHRQHNGSHPF